MKKIIVAITAVTVMAFASMLTAFADGPAAEEKGFQASLELQSVANVASLLQAAREMQEMNQHFSMQYLTLQQNIQGESREFNLLSNVMKTKHEAAKNAVNNIR